MTEPLTDAELDSLRGEDWEYQTNGQHIVDLLATVDAERRKSEHHAEAVNRALDKRTEMRAERDEAIALLREAYGAPHWLRAGGALTQRVDAFLASHPESPDPAYDDFMEGRP